MNKLLKEIDYRSWFVFPLILYSFLNFGNYSFLNYSLYGYGQNSIISNLKYLRPILAMIPVFLILVKPEPLKLFVYVLLKNTDVFLFIILLVISLIFDQNKFYPAWLIFSIFSFLVLFIYFRLRSESNTEFVEKFVIFILVSASIAIPFTFLSIPNLIENSEIYFSSKNAYAYFNLIIIVATLSLLIVRKKKMNFKIIIFIGLNIIILLLSGRRTPLITSLIALILFIVFYSKSLKAYFFSFSLIFIISLYGTFLSDNFLSVQRMEKIDIEDETYDSSYQSRLELRDYYMNLVEESNYFGIGFNKKLEDDEKLSTHNTFLSIYLILGFVGIFVFFVIIIRSFLFVVKSNRNDLILVYSILLLPVFTINWVETNFMPGQIFFIYTFTVLLSPRFLLNP